MSKCLKCSVNIDSLSDRCPLCNSEIEIAKYNSYPKITSKINISENPIAKKIVPT